MVFVTRSAKSSLRCVVIVCVTRSASCGVRRRQFSPSAHARRRFSGLSRRHRAVNIGLSPAPLGPIGSTQHTSTNTNAIRSNVGSKHVGRIRANRQCVARPNFVLARKPRASLAQRRAPCRAQAPSVDASLASDPATQSGGADACEEGTGAASDPATQIADAADDHRHFLR